MTDNSLLFEEDYKPEEELEEEYDLEYDDIVTSVVNSLKCHAIDYCYTRKDMQAIFDEAKRLKLSMYYQEFLDEDGALDYFKVVPARFYSYDDNGRILLEGQCYKIQDIPVKLQCVISKRGHAYTLKNFNEPIKL